MQKISKRSFLKTMFGGVGVVAMQSAIGQTLTCSSTPQQVEGPFYPVNSQEDTDNDLTRVHGRRAKAQGQIVLLTGQVTESLSCAALAGAVVEIWQACSTGAYNHPGDTENRDKLDPNFQYWGIATTNSNGQYNFKTIVPGSYPATSDWIRPPHIHMKVHKRGYKELTTQMYFQGNRYNSGDRILQSLSAEERSQVVIPIINNNCTFNLAIEKM